MITFVQPKLLANDLPWAVRFERLLKGTRHCLYNDCEQTLPAGARYDPTTANGSQETFGLYIASVSNQEELGSNFGRLSAAGVPALFIWIQPNATNDQMLYAAPSPTYGSGQPILTENGAPIIASMLGKVKLHLRRRNDGGIILIGIIDS